MELQNFYTEDVLVKLNAGATKLYITNKPTPTSGYLVINPQHTSLREIIKYDGTGNDGSGDYVDIIQRGVGGTLDVTHEVGEPVRMNITAEHWADLVADIDGLGSDKFNKSDVDTDVTLSADSDDKVASQKAVKAYIATENAKDVHLEGDQTINGVKTFSQSPVIPNSSNPNEPVTQQQLEDAGGVVALANETMAGKVMLANDSDIASENDERDGKPLVVVPSKIPQPYWKATKTYEENNMAWHEGKTWYSTVNSNINHNPDDGDRYDTPFDFTSYIKQDIHTEMTGYYNFISKGGEYVYMMDNGANQIRRFPIVDGVMQSSDQVISDSNDFTSGSISPDGTKIYFGKSQYMYQYTLTTAFDLTTMTDVHSIAFSENVSIEISSDGTTIYGAGTGTNKYIRYKTLSTPFDITTAGSEQSWYTAKNYHLSISISNNDTRLYFTEDSGDNLYVLDMDSANSFAGKSYTDLVIVDAVLTSYRPYFSITSDGIYYVVAGGTGTEELFLHLCEAYWKQASNIYGEIKNLKDGVTISTYTFVDDGFMTCSIQDNNTVAIYLNGIKIGNFQDSSNNAMGGNVSMPVYAGDVLSFSESTTVVLAIRVKE